MKRVHIYILFVAALLSSCSMPMLRDEPLLQAFPTRIDIAAWQMDQEPRVIGEVDTIVGNPAKLFGDFRVRTSWRASYTHTGDALQVLVIAATFHSALEAHGFLSRERGDSSLKEFGLNAWVTPLQGIVRKGSTLVMVRYAKETPQSQNEIRTALKWIYTSLKDVDETPWFISLYENDQGGRLLYDLSANENWYGLRDLCTIPSAGNAVPEIAFSIKDDALAAQVAYRIIIERAKKRIVVLNSDGDDECMEKKDDGSFVVVLRRDKIIFGVRGVKTLDDGRAAVKKGVEALITSEPKIP